MIEHPIDEPAADRHVEPEREGPARDPLMLGKIARERTSQRDDHQWDDGNRQQDMGAQDGQINGPKGPLTGKEFGAKERPAGDIDDQKERGQYGCGEHAPLMVRHITACDEGAPDDDADPAR